MSSRIDEVLDAARARLDRMPADDVPGALKRGAVLVDIRPQAQRDREGHVPAALVINATCWSGAAIRPAMPDRRGVDDDVEWVVLCSEGYTSSLAAASLIDLGLHKATDVVGGYHALKAEGVLV